jgi:hypothetical protein
VNTTSPITINLATGDGSPVPDGTEVVFTASRGQLESPKARTKNGVATVNFKAPADSGPVQLVGSSAEARAIIDLAVTSAPVASVKITANPALLPAAGGETEIVATVLSPSNQLVSGAPVKFKTGAGTLNLTTATTDQSGTARARLQTKAAAVVNANVHNLHSADVSVRLQAPVKPPPSPAPPPNPSPGPSPEPGVPFSLDDVVWLHTDVSGWRATSRITDISIGDPPICIDHTKSGHWPVVGNGEGNPWVFANVNGRWYAATYEWLKPGQTCKGISAATIGPHTKKEPLETWRPRSGELVGFMVSGLARGSERSTKERSNIVMVRWP